jgi:hypothetical protein
MPERQHLMILAAMALGRRHEADAAMAVLMVVLIQPVNELLPFWQRGQLSSLSLPQ